MTKHQTFKAYVHSLLKKNDRTRQITRPAVDTMNGILEALAEKLSNSAQLLTKGSEKKTLSEKELESAMLAIFPSRLATMCNSYANKAMDTYRTNISENETSQAKPVMRETRAGLTISVSFSEKFLRGFGQIKYNISSLAPVFLASVLEYVCELILIGSAKVCVDAGRRNICIRHIFLALTNEEEPLLEPLIFDTLNVLILGAGVKPFIHSSLLPKAGRRRTKKASGSTESETTTTTEKKHRYLPGTVALREVRKYQKSSNVLIQRAPFQRLVRDVATEVEPDKTFRFTSNFMSCFQELVETRVTEILRNSNEVAIHAGRETVFPEDIDLIVRLHKLPDLYESIGEEASFVPLAAVKKLNYRAGIKRFAGDANARVQTLVRSLIHDYLHYITVCTSHNDRQTVNTRFLIEGLQLCGISLSIVPEKRKVRRVRSSTSQAGSASGDDEQVYDPEKEEAEHDENVESDDDAEEIVTTPARARAGGSAKVVSAVEISDIEDEEGEEEEDL